MNCTICNTPMKTLFTGFYCVNDCDRKPATSLAPRAPPGSGPLRNLVAYMYPSNATKFNHGQRKGAAATLVPEPCVWDNCSQPGCTGLIETKRIVMFATQPTKEAGFVTLCGPRPLGVPVIDTITMQTVNSCIEYLLGCKDAASHLAYYLTYP